MQNLNKQILADVESLGMEEACRVYGEPGKPLKPGTIKQWQRTGQPSFKAADVFFQRKVVSKTQPPPKDDRPPTAAPERPTNGAPQTVPPPPPARTRKTNPKTQPNPHQPRVVGQTPPLPVEQAPPTGAEAYPEGTPGVMIGGVFYPTEQAPVSRRSAAPMMAVDPRDPEGMTMPVSSVRPASPPKRNPGLVLQPGPERPGGGAAQISPHLMQAFLQFMQLMGYIQPEGEEIVATIPLKGVVRPTGWNRPHATPGSIDGYPEPGVRLVLVQEEPQ